MFRTTIGFVRGASIACLLAIAPVYSAAAAGNNIETRAVGLDPGEYLWEPAGAPDGPVEVVVSVPLQMAYVYRGGALIGASTVSTGMAGYDTPVGRFEILQKRKTHFSNRYDNAPMPFMQRLTWDGIALHAGAIPGYPASHGCVRLPKAFAQKLFAVTRLGAAVTIIDGSPASPGEALAMASSAGSSASFGSGSP